MAKIESNILSIFIVVLLAVGGGMFLAGMKYQDSRGTSVAATSQQAPGGARNGNMQGPPGMQGGSGNMQGPPNMQGGSGNMPGGFASGEVVSKDDKSITIKLQDGSSETIYFSSSTTVSETTTGSTSDLKTGQTVVVIGSNSSNGSVTAQSIQIRPAGSEDFGPGGMDAGASSGA
ncbi:MAG: hypothetical protein Q7K29_04030 [Thermoleophilia bacterium]|nr:hypothetical protein [Thermoleophilia bacterium]